MKRFLVLLLVAVMAVPALFADVKVGGWGRVFTYVAGSDVEDSDVVLDQGPGWNGGGVRARFDVLGSSDQIGFAIEVNTDVPNGNYYGGNIGLGDRVLIWIKPIEMLKIEAGRVGTVDTLRGKFGAGIGSGTSYFSGDFEDNIFARTRVNSGIVFELNPVEGLNFILALDIRDGDALSYDNDLVRSDVMTNDDNDVNTPDVLTGYNWTNQIGALERIQVGVGYNIDGIGLARVQYMGNGMVLGSEFIQIAFALTAVEGLLVDIGATIDLNTNYTDLSSVPLTVATEDDAKDITSIADPDAIKIALGASYQVTDALKVSTSNVIQLEDDIIFKTFLMASYNLGAISAVLEVAADLTDGSKAMTIFPYALMGLGNGKASLGFKVEMGLEDGGATTWAIPLLMEYWF